MWIIRRNTRPGAAKFIAAMKKDYILLKGLEVYKLAGELSGIGRRVYESLNWQDKKIMGGRFIEAPDAAGANIAGGYGRFHYLDKIKFYYNSRASLLESCQHWLELLRERNKIKKDNFKKIKDIQEKFLIKLNNFITLIHKAKNNKPL